MRSVPLAFGRFAALTLVGVEPGEVSEREENFPAHFHDFRDSVTVQALRNGGDGGDIAGDIFPGHAVPTRGGYRQRAIVIAQVDGETVDFRFRGDRGAGAGRFKSGTGYLRSGASGPGFSRERGVPGTEILERKNVLEGVQAFAVRDRGERLRRGHRCVPYRRPDGAAGGICHRELRVARFQVTQLVNEAVVVIIRHERVRPGMVGDLRASQRGGNLIPAVPGLINAHAPIVPHGGFSSNPQRTAGRP